MSKPIRTTWLLDAETSKNLPSISAGVEYHRVLAGERRRVLRGILAIFLTMAGLVGFSIAVGALTALLDTRLGNDPTDYTPLRHAGAMIGLALLLPWSMLLQRWLYGVPGISLHSVISRFRFAVFGRALVVFGPVWLAVNMVGFFLPGAETVPWSQTELMAMLLVTLLLTPLQAAGEEYGVRGLMFRVVGGWTRSSKLGLILAIVVTSVLFTVMHGSADPYIVGWYMSLWVGLGIITWRTGGLEIPVLLHAVLNTFNFVAAFTLHIDFGAAIGDRPGTTGEPYLLLPGMVVLGFAALIWWWTRKTGPALTSDRPSGEAA